MGTGISKARSHSTFARLAPTRSTPLHRDRTRIEQCCGLLAEANEHFVIRVVLFHPGVAAQIPVMGLFPVSLLPPSHCQEEKVEARASAAELRRLSQGMDRGLPIVSAEVGDAQSVPVGGTLRVLG